MKSSRGRLSGVSARSATQIFALVIMLTTASVIRADDASGDPLHGYCSPAATQCADNGTNSPTSQNPPTGFGFTVSPGPASGDLVIDLLAPNNLDPHPGDVVLKASGSVSGTFSLFGGLPATAWTTGDLATFLGDTGASPNNPIGAYLPSTQTLDAGATGFFVYQLNLGTMTLNSPSNPNVFPLENLNLSVPIGSYIVGFFNEGTAASPNWVATANSGAIFETSPPGGCASCTFGGPVPEPSYASLLGLFGGLMVVAYRMYQKRTA